jgi:alpha-mannosidase
LVAQDRPGGSTKPNYRSQVNISGETMHKHAEITRQRIRTFGEERGFKKMIYPERRPVNLFVYHAPDRVPYATAVRQTYVPIQVGEVLGPAWSTHWFRVEVEIPVEWTGKEVHFLWDSSSEACIWIDGKPRQGLTGTPSSPWEAQMGRLAYRLTKHAKKGERYGFYVEMACNGLFGSEPAAVFPLKIAQIALFDRDAWDLYWDYTVIADMALLLPANTPRAGQALWAANEMINECRFDDPESWKIARRTAAAFFKARNGDAQHDISAIGYAHLDTAWLWPLAETKRKAVRTFSTTMRLMEDFPDYKFASAQAQHLDWIKELQPDLYEQVRRRIHEGRFIIVGGTWVEPDCNIPSGESLVRQFLHGQRYFQKEFGFTCQEFWNPDVFGYSAALPQIMQKSGIRFFLTQKLSWNQINKPNNHTFLWEGIDGSQVLTHFPPGDTYGSAANVADVLKTMNNFKEHDRANESILIFGWGDGGGGPTPEMIEQIQRMKDVDGLPRVEIRTVENFFERCEKDIKDPVVWVGELYFELHRGTYTTQAANKRDNRRCEFLLRDVEVIASLAHAKSKQPAYPEQKLDQLWKVVLLNQFHDILPGSSINIVYKDSAVQYQEVIESAQELRNVELEKALGKGKQWTAVNTLSTARREVIELPFEVNSSQKSCVGRSLGIVDAPAMTYTPVSPETKVDHPVTIKATPNGIELENQFIKVVFQKNGALTSLFDKRIKREAVEVGKVGNRFVLFDDDPINFEAWDVDIFHLEKSYGCADAHIWRVLEEGPLRGALEFEYELGTASHIKQTIFMSAVSPRLDFHTWVDWHENQRFLKVEFPWEIRAEAATYEIQFGHLQRPTHTNTSWDLARFEVMAHKWADLSEPGFGVALLNDSKFGYSTQRNVMRLSMLRAPKSPDPVADMGEHNIRYALLPHPGTFREAGVIEEGYRFNVPLLFCQSGIQKESEPFMEVDQPSVIIDTVKKAEDGDEIIVRMFEAHGGRCPVRFTSWLPVRKAAFCNLLEKEDQAIEWINGGVDFTIKPFEIITLKLSL